MASLNSSLCFLPDQQTTGKGLKLVPCDPSVPHSACCTVTESCTLSGLCYGNEGRIYRGGCTDQTWKDPACANTICSGTNSNMDDGNPSGVTFLSVCEYNSGNPAKWACGLGNSGCSKGNFTLAIGAITHMNITGNLSALATPTITNIIHPSMCPPPSPACNTTKVGAGVGVALGIALISSLIWATIERRRRMRVCEESASVGERYESVQLASDAKYLPSLPPQTNEPVAEMPGRRYTGELEGN